MAVPVVAIVGRPNVGKSSLFNWLAGRRISIVDPTAGVTRDRISTLLQFDERFCELVDTGGMGIEDSDNLTDHVEHQINQAIDQADVIMFIVDVRAGLVPLDLEVATRLRPLNKPVLLVANKCDVPQLDLHSTDFHRLGRGAPLCVSVEQKRGRDELLAAILDMLPPPGDEETVVPAVDLKLAIVGRRNVGKSTFINCLAKTERVIVSEVAGTTRDSVDVRFELDGKAIIAIDTAGVRRKKSLESDIEFYSMARAERSIRRADVVMHFFDPRLRISKVDKVLAEYIFEEHKPAVFVVNKWDLARLSMPTERFANYIRSMFPMLDYVPIAFITAKNGKNVQALLNLAQALHKQACQRISTNQLNQVLREAIAAQEPPLRQNRRAKIYYATQVDANPPTIVLFTNGPELFDNTYVRYLLKYFRDHLPFTEVPIKLYLRNRKRDEANGKSDDDDSDTPPKPKAKASHPPKAKPQPQVEALDPPAAKNHEPARNRKATPNKSAPAKAAPNDAELWQDV